MSRVRLLFSTTRNPISLLVRLASGSRWSHVALVDGDQVIEAVFFGGVREVPIDLALTGTIDHRFVEIPAFQPQAIIDAARSQLGKPYDWAAIAGLGLRRDWQDDDAWFCSELVAWAAAIAGESWFRCEALHRITPQHLWMLPPHPESYCMR